MRGERFNRRVRWGILLVVAGLVCGVTLETMGQQQRRPRGKTVRTPSNLFDGNPPRHVGEYPAFNLVWQAEERVRDVRAVFPHPLSAREIVLATGSGLVITEDTGKTWKEIPGTGPGAIGEVRHVEFSLDGSGAMYVASASKGVWRIDDVTKGPMQIGSKETGLISDSVSQVRVDGGDPMFKTLVAVHGAEAGGMSRSRDGGKTWATVPGMEDYFIAKLLCGGPGVPWAFAIASQKDPTASRGIYFCLSVGDFFKDYAGDVQANDGALEILFERPFPEASDLAYWATATSGLLKTEHNGTNVTRIGPADIDKWSSIGVTYGATADSRILYAYEPTKTGFSVSQDDGKTFTPFSQGLPKGGFVKQGAQVRANAGGSVFFAAINNGLYVGRRHTGTIAISEISVTPAAVSFAPTRWGEAFNDFRGEIGNLRNQRNAAAEAGATVEKLHELKSSVSDMMFTVTARIAEADDEGAGKAKDEAASVTVDLSRVGGSTVTPMYDDGLHGDGAANDGVYGATCLLRPDRLRTHYQDKRRPEPGPMALTITAASADGTLSSAVGMLGLLDRVETHAFYVPTMRYGWKDAEGDVGITLDDYEAAGDQRALKMTAKGKPWSVPLANYYDRGVIGYQALSFYVKADEKAPKELYVQLKDSSPDTVPAVTVKVAVVKEGLVEGGVMDGKFRRVVVPMSRLLQDGEEGTPRFRPTMLHAVVISGDGGEGSYWISAVKFHAAGEEIKADAEGRHR